MARLRQADTIWVGDPANDLLELARSWVARNVGNGQHFRRVFLNLFSTPASIPHSGHFKLPASTLPVMSYQHFGQRSLPFARSPHSPKCIRTIAARNNIAGMVQKSQVGMPTFYQS